MKHLALIPAFILGVAIGKIHAPAEAVPTIPKELKNAVIDSAFLMYQKGYQAGLIERNNHIGLVRMTVEDVEVFTR